MATLKSTRLVIEKMVRLFHQNGVPVGTHAVGDRAIDWVVDTYALVEQNSRIPDCATASFTPTCRLRMRST